MALFEYKCNTCNQTEEFLEKFSESSAKDCKFCGNKGTMFRIISLTSFALSGSGWYSDSYQHKGSK